MPIGSDYTEIRLSGGLTNTVPASALGGAMSTEVNGVVNDRIAHGVFDRVTLAQAQSGHTDYRCLYVKNKHASADITAVTLLQRIGPSNTKITLELGNGSSAVNGTEQTIANETTAPTNVTFTTPSNSTEGVELATSLSNGKKKAFWLKRVTAAGALAEEDSSYRIGIRFSIPKPAVPTWTAYHFMAVGDIGCKQKTTPIRKLNNPTPSGTYLSKVFLALGNMTDNDDAGCILDHLDDVDYHPKGNNNGLDNPKSYMAFGAEDVKNTQIKNQLRDAYEYGDQYGSYQRDNAYYIFMSTEKQTVFTTGSDVYKFVESELKLANNNGDIVWIIVCMNKNMYTATAPNAPIASLRDVYHPLFEKYEVDLVLQSRNHNYQRSKVLMYNAADPANPTIVDAGDGPFDRTIEWNGMWFYTVGTGGLGTLDTVSSPPSYIKTTKHDTRGMLSGKFTNNNSTLTLAFIKETDDLSFDTIVINK